MITCQHATRLFDRYLDGELSPSLQAELHAHQLSCPDCQNELAMYEVCGDVIRLDRREPGPGDAFTDRVMLAYRSRGVRRFPRWHRAALLVVSPMAAAASIALAVWLILPSATSTRTEPVVAHYTEAVPVSVQDALRATHQTQLSAEAEQVLSQTPQMSAVGFMDALLKPVVDHAQTTLDGARHGAAQLELLLRAGWADPTEKLVAEWRAHQHQESTQFDGSPDSFPVAPDPLDPGPLNRPSSGESHSGELLEAL